MYIGLTEANDSFCLLKTSVCEKFPLPSTMNDVVAYSIPAWMQVLQNAGLTEANDSFWLLKSSLCEKFPLPLTINNIIAFSIPAWMQVLKKETIHFASKDLCMWEISTAFDNKQYDCLQHSCILA